MFCVWYNIIIMGTIYCLGGGRGGGMAGGAVGVAEFRSILEATILAV